MEMTTAEFAAVNGVACDLLDAQGRLVITPNALTLDGQSNIPADLRLGESLAAFLARHVPGIASGAWAVSIGGRAVPQAMWARTYPKHGQLIACRCTVRKTVLPLIAMLALTYFTMGAGAGWIASSFGVTAGGTAAAMIGAGLFVAGSLIINKVLGPKVPKPGDSTAREVYSLSSQRNSVRAYEPLPVLWGEMRVTPDLASLPYTWYEGDDQYLSTILLGGVNVHSVADLAVGDTPITSYEGVELYHNGFSGMPSVPMPLQGNVDTVAGAELPDSSAWVTRTTSAGVVGIGVDYEMQLFAQGKAGLKHAVVNLETFYRAVGASEWIGLVNNDGPGKWGVSNNTSETRRFSFTVNVSQGQYEVRTRRLTGVVDKVTCKVQWATLRSIQADATDYSAWGRIGIKIKATGQLSGALDTLRATYRARPLPVWTGTQWITAATREEGLCNPGAILLQTLRGVYAGGVLQFGFGLQDAQIDIDGIKAFMLHCAARGYTYDRWITGQVSLGAFCDEVALAGMGQFTWTDGSRPTVSFVGSGQPISGVVNMANMLKGSFSVAYNLSNAADGIEYQYLDRNRNWETQTLRVAAPGVVTMLNPARISGDGVTTEAHAAAMARYHLAQSLYQYKTIDFGADIEHLDYRRLSVLSLSHDMTQWGFGGRVVSAQTVSGKVVLTLDESVPALPTRYVGLRVPGARDYRVFAVEAFAGDTSNTITLVGAWPAGMAFPGAGINNPAHDTLWCYDFKATPGYRVRVVSIEPEADLKGARVSCVPEGPEFWDYVLNGSYTPAPGQSSLPQLARPSASNLRISEQVNVQGDTEWYELHAVWDATGDYDHAQVWAARDGSEMRLVDGNATGSRSTFRIGGAGEWLVEVRPFNTAGLVGQSATALYITTTTQRPPRNVDAFVVQEVAGGLRRFAWQYVGDRPPAFAGVQIRYVPGDVPLSVADWDGMQPLGAAADVYRAQFETTRPEAGQWTFGIRAIDTAGQLSPGVLRFVATLDDSFEQVQQPDFTPPPAPAGFAAIGMFASVQTRWDAPAYTVGHGHARTEIWAGASADRAQAQKLAEGYAGPVSFEWPLGGTVHAWARHVTNDGVPGEWAGPAVAQTAEDVSLLLDVLDGQITSSQLHQALSDPIGWIAQNPVNPAGRTLVDAAAQQDVLNQQLRGSMEEMAQGLLEAALAADAALERITDAGIYVDPATGQVKIYGLETTKQEVTQLEVLLDAVNGQLALRATTAYVDNKISQAVLSPADLLLYEGLDARIVSVSQNLDSINGTLAQKANALEVQQALARLTTAESSLDALSGQIALRVTRAEYEAGQDALNTRLGSAEITLGALDIPAITATVIASRQRDADAEKTARALLQDILTGESNRVQAHQALAFARSELSAAITDGLQAEAQQRTQLAVQFGQQMSAVEQSLSSLSAADVAEAAARLALAAKVEREQQQLQAQIETESQARADAVSAEASARQTLAATVSSNHSAALAAAQAASDAAGSKGKVIFGSSAPAVADRLVQNLWIDSTGGANTPKRWNGSAWVAVTDKAATDAAAAAAQAQATANNAVAAIQTEQNVRANETGHLGALYSVRMQLSQGGKQVIGGFGLSGTSSGTAGATIDFGVLANKFFVAAPEGSGIASNFQLTIQTTPTTANGVTIPAGLYVDSAFITNVSALWGRFGTLVADSIQATAISASQLTAGNGVIGGSLKSSNYVAGSSGWQLRPDGVAEFSGVIVRGTVYATSGTVGGWELSGDRIRSAGFTANSGVLLRSDGHIYARNAATNVTFNTAATDAGEVLRIGTALVVNARGDAIFGGTLSARVVNTDNIVGGAVLRTRFTSAANEITVGSPVSTGSEELLSLSFSADAGRPMLMTATVCYQASNNWIAGAYGTQHTTMYYLTVARRIRFADGAVQATADIYSAWVGQATKLSTANYQYGLGVASASFQTPVPSIPEGGWVEYYIRMASSGQGGFVVRSRSITAQEIRI